MSTQRRVALIGSGEGPWISTQGLREPRAKITGMKDGGRLYIIMSPHEVPGAEENLILAVEENGIHVLRESKWMRVSCEGGGRSVICDILTRKAVA